LDFLLHEFRLEANFTMQFRPYYWLFFWLFCFETHAQGTLGLLFSTPANEDGFVLFAPISSTTTYLIDKCGYQVHSWPSTHQPGQSVYLLQDGSLMRTGRLMNQTFNAGGLGGIIERIDWDGNVVWSYVISSATECQHHDICPLPNGNVMAIAYELKTAAQATDAGRNPEQLSNVFWSEKIIEIQPSGTNAGTIVWEWQVWDHLVQSFDSTKANYAQIDEHPELLDINYGGGTASDWLHCNGLDYNETLDQIVLSCHNSSEIWIIDHSTNTAEAASHTGGNSGKGGDFLFRWGNPQVYGHGTVADQKFFGQHNPTWIKSGLQDDGRLMVFNNGVQRPGGNYSTVDVIASVIDTSGQYVMDVNQAYLPQSTSWMYTPSPSFYAMNISGAHRMANGHTMICSGPQGNFIEIDYDGNTVWSYKSPVGQNGAIATQGSNATQNIVFRCTQYPVDYSAFIGRDLTPGTPIELNPLAYDCTMLEANGVRDQSTMTGFSVFAAQPDELRVTPTSTVNHCSFSLYDISGRRWMTWSGISLTAGQTCTLHLNEDLHSGIYLFSMEGTGGQRVVVRLVTIN
jgi:hypothetical protein